MWESKSTPERTPGRWPAEELVPGLLHSVSGNDIEFDNFHTSEAQVILVTSRFSGDKPALVPGHIIPCQCKTWESTSAPEEILGCWSSAGSQPRSWWKVISSNVIQRN
jgi:hypothetical protein